MILRRDSSSSSGQRHGDTEGSSNTIGNLTNPSQDTQLLINYSNNTLLDNNITIIALSPDKGKNIQSLEAGERVKFSENPQYGTFYGEYDPMTGARTAAILGSCLMMLVFYIAYKAKCHRDWSEEDDYYLKQYKQRQLQKEIAQQGGPRKSVNYIIDPVCPDPDPEILAATATWVKLQPLESAVPDPPHGEKRRTRYPLSRVPSVSAENIHKQTTDEFGPYMPNGHGPVQHDDFERYDDYISNSYLIAERERYRRLSNIDPNHLDPGDELYFEYGSYSRRQSRYPDDSDDNCKEIIIPVEVKREKPPLQQCTSIDRHNNNHNHNSHLLSDPLNYDPIDNCSKCMADMNISDHDMHDPQRPSLMLPSVNPDHHYSKSRGQRNRSRVKVKQRSMETTGSSLGSSSQQQSMDDDSPVFCLSTLPARDAAPSSFDVNDLSSNENSSDQHLPSASVRVPNLAFINTLVNNTTFSTMSTATASSNGSYQSECPDIPLSDLPPSLRSPHSKPRDNDTVTEQHKHVVEVTIETAALQSSSKSKDEMDTHL